MSTNTTNSSFSVLDMAQEYASAQDVDVSEIFRQHPVSGNIKAESEKENPESVETTEPPVDTDIKPQEEAPKKKKQWTPDPKLTEGMEELNSQPVTYSEEELVVEDEELKNITDDTAIQEARETMDELSRKTANIEDAKKRHGILKFQIPEGQYHALIFAAAGDTNYKRAQQNLDELFNEIKEIHPEFILEWAPGADKNPAINNDGNVVNMADHMGKIADIPNDQNSAAPVDQEANDETNSIPQGENASISQATDEGTADAKINIDKRNVSQVTWSDEELEKIRKSRTVELNIVESADLDFASIEDADDNAVNAVLSTYIRKANDVTAALPASKYRATFIGLSYTDVIDLSNSQEMNNIDGEYKKWSICFDHIRNQSIGPWREYRWYIDPNTKKKVTVDMNDPIPENIPDNQVYTVSKFEDFLMKTSFMDLEFMLWKILCATAMDQEIISIDCHAAHDGKVCNNNYDWIYSPSELLLMDSIDPAVLEEMRITGEASTIEEVMKNYKSSPLNAGNTVKLPTSGFRVVFGHISAYDYLTSIYGQIQSLKDEDENDPSLASRSLNYTTLTVIKAFLVPKEDGSGYIRISGSNNLLKVINNLNEIDWQTLSEIVKIMIEPYRFNFALRDIVCPKCKNRSSIPIDSMSKLLFIVARSLSSVQVELRKI